MRDSHFRNHNLTRGARWLALGLIALALTCWIGRPGPGLTLADEAPQNGRSESGSGGVGPDVSPTKLYESVTGYLKGLRSGKESKEKEARPKPRYRPVEPRPAERSQDDSVTMVEAEIALARQRMNNGEWELAIQAIRRALEIASKLNSQEETAKLQEMLQVAKSKAAATEPQPAPKHGEIVNSVGMKLVLIRPKTFMMGSSPAELRRVENTWNAPRNALEPEEPAHKVRLTRNYYLGKYEVTVGQFRRFAEETGYVTVAEKQGWGWTYDANEKKWAKTTGASWRNPGGQVWEDHPVTLICHDDAEAFCKWLSDKEGRGYHLPTEAQWEFASRGGKEEQRFPWGSEHPDGRKLNMADRRSPVPWSDRTVDDGHEKWAAVGSYAPNDYWLYDMSGNLWELCSDVFSSGVYQGSASKVTVDPTGPRRGKTHAVRGGCWAFGAGIARNAWRFGLEPKVCVDVSGFRVAVTGTEADPSDLRIARSPTADTPENRADIKWVMERVKALVASGQRVEARRLVDEYVKGGGSDKLSMESDALLKKLLDSLIDVTQDESLQSFNNSLDMKMVRIPAGSFIMGSSEADIAWAMTSLAQGMPVQLENEYPFHKVRISRPFFISSTEVTVGQFRTFVDETGYVTDAEADGGGQVFDTKENRFERKDGLTWRNPGWKIDDSQPVVLVSYNDALAFLDWLTAREKLPYKLPTEAQWEYAARGKKIGQFPWGDSLPDGRKANYADKNTDFEWRDRYADDGYKYVAPVGSYEPNDWGLYDMAGNVLEWVRDYYGEDYYRFTPEVDPEGPGQGENRVTKGGEWTFGPVNLRCAFRGWSRPDLAFYNTGFRVCVDLANSRLPFHFASNFLTNDWTPGPDQREVAAAIARQKERETGILSSRSSGDARPVALPPQEAPISGVMILDFSPRSDAADAGLARGDVIIEYDGVRGLDAAKLIALTDRAKQDRKKPILVLIRNGYEYSVRVDGGFLGITVMNTRLRGPFKKPEPEPDRDKERKRKDRKKPLEWT